MKLTDNEIETLETHLCGFEKRAGRRGSLAWVYLGMCLFFLVLMAFAWSLLHHHIAGAYESMQGGAAVRDAAASRRHMGGPYLFAAGVVFLLSVHMTVWSLVQAVKSWRQGPKELVIAKVLRAKWDEEKAAMAAKAEGGAGESDH